MTRSDLIAELLIVATIIDQITDALARGGRVELRGFGTFTMRRLCVLGWRGGGSRLMISSSFSVTAVKPE